MNVFLKHIVYLRVFWFSLCEQDKLGMDILVFAYSCGTTGAVILHLVWISVVVWLIFAHISGSIIFVTLCIYYHHKLCVFIIITSYVYLLTSQAMCIYLPTFELIWHWMYMLFICIYLSYVIIVNSLLYPFHSDLKTWVKSGWAFGVNSPTSVWPCRWIQSTCCNKISWLLPAALSDCLQITHHNSRIMIITKWREP